MHSTFHTGLSFQGRLHPFHHLRLPLTGYKLHRANPSPHPLMSVRQVCDTVVVEREKCVLKQAAVQHLYGQLAGYLREDATDASLLAALHPTPAVCGRPRQTALEVLQGTEVFDRGLYAGPFGWISGGAAEFSVAIRSALVQPQRSEQHKALLAAEAMEVSCYTLGVSLVSLHVSA